jgi:SHO1 osmosensor
MRAKVQGQWTLHLEISPFLSLSSPTTMPPRGNEGFDFTPILTHYLFLFTSILSIVCSFIICDCAPLILFIIRPGGSPHSYLNALSVPVFAMVRFRVLISYAPADIFFPGGRAGTGSLWFAIFLQFFLILGVLYTLATDSISMHRFQISIFGAIAIVFAVDGVTQGVFSPIGAQNAMGAGWFILTLVDILWVLYFTSEEDSLALHIFNMLGTGGLTPPSRRRRTRTQSSMHNMQAGNGYQTNYASGGGIGSHDGYDAKMGGSGGFGSPNPAGIRSQNSFGGSLNDNMTRSIGGTGAGSIHNQPAGGGAGSIGGVDNGPSSPLMAGIGSGNSGAGSNIEAPQQQPESYAYRAKALYACEFPPCPSFINILHSPRYRKSRRSERNIICQGRDLGNRGQTREVVASQEGGWNIRK